MTHTSPGWLDFRFHVPKPVDPHDLISVIAKVTGRAS
jgi:hypothetical protein